MRSEPNFAYRPGWPTRPDGSFTVGPGEAAWREFLRVATDEQVRQAIRALEGMDHPQDETGA